MFSILMLAIPVMPHHHHANGKICMKDDVQENCCQHHHDDNEAQHHHSCEDTGCITTHFFQQIPSNNPRIELAEESHPIYLIVADILSQALIANNDNPSFNDYRESLHSTQIMHAMGLRAPPCA